MSLDWNAQRVANFDEGTPEWKEHVAYFCWALMAISINGVTKKNLGEIYTRLKIYEALEGPVRYHYDEETKVKTSVYDFDFIKSVIGYGTNVSNLTFGQWIKTFGKNEIERAQKHFDKSLAKDREPAEV